MSESYPLSLVAAEPAASERDVLHFYADQGGSRMFDARFLTPEMARYLAEEGKALERFFALHPECRHLIEMGCGFGRYLDWAAARHLDYDGVEPVSWLVELGRLRLNRHGSEKTSSRRALHNLCAETFATVALRKGFIHEDAAKKSCILFPFNCLGNIRDFQSTLEAIAHLPCAIFVSTFKTDAAATAVRREYYERCGYTGLNVKTFAWGNVIASEEGLYSQVFEMKFLEKAFAAHGYAPAGVSEYGGIGVGCHFEKTRSAAVSERRKQARRKADLTVNMTVLETGSAGGAETNPEAALPPFQNLEARTSDISDNGIAVVTKLPLKPESLVKADILLGANERVTFIAEVCRAQEVPGGHLSALKIRSIDAGARRKLKRSLPA